MRDIQFRLSLIFTKEDMKRITIKEKNGETKIMADVHGMSVKNAKRFINNIINVVRTAVEIIVIHGFNHGTAIKDMIASGIDNSRVSVISPDYKNQGITHIIAA